MWIRGRDIQEHLEESRLNVISRIDCTMERGRQEDKEKTKRPIAEPREHVAKLSELYRKEKLMEGKQSLDWRGLG